MAVHGTCMFGGKVQNVFLYYGEREGGRERGRKGKIRNGTVFLIQIIQGGKFEDGSENRRRTGIMFFRA